MAITAQQGAHAPRSPAGMTLYEVLLALGIMLVSISILAGHIQLGTRAAVEANLRTEAALLAETKLNEILAGAEPMVDVANAPFLDPIDGGPALLPVEGEWTWTLAIRQGVPHVDTITIALAVDRTGRGTPVRYTLRRIVRDPTLFSEAAAAETAAEEETQ